MGHCALQELEYLNLAVNNITCIENLHRCESLRRLDMTMNFIPLAALTSLTNLAGLYALRELYLLGNPCTQWPFYRSYVMAILPQLQQLVIPWIEESGWHSIGVLAASLVAAHPLSFDVAEMMELHSYIQMDSQDGQDIMDVERSQAMEQQLSMQAMLGEHLLAQDIDLSKGTASCAYAANEPEEMVSSG